MQRAMSSFAISTGWSGAKTTQRSATSMRARCSCAQTGMPLVWIGRRRGLQGVGRVYGPDLMRFLMGATRDGSATHYLFGGRPGVAKILRSSLQQRFTGVRIVGTYTPPFGPMSGEQLDALREDVARVKPDLFWVGLSTPKQELFMADQLANLDTKIMLGVGRCLTTSPVRSASPLRGFVTRACSGSHESPASLDDYLGVIW